MTPSSLEAEAMLQIRAHKLPIPVTEYRFCPDRRWRCDLCWLDKMLICELEGGVFILGGGRHQRGQGFEKDCEKYNSAALMGYTVLRVTSTHLKNGMFIEWIKKALGYSQIGKASAFDAGTVGSSPATPLNEKEKK